MSNKLENLEWIRKLHYGDEVRYRNPETKQLEIWTIRRIVVLGKIVKIWDIDGSYLECFPDELS